MKKLINIGNIEKRPKRWSADRPVLPRGLLGLRETLKRALASSLASNIIANHNAINCREKR